MKNKKPIVYVVNGIGHCGTTLVYLFAKPFYRSFGPSEMVTTMDDLNHMSISKDCIFKTHTRYPAEHKDLDVRVLYMFGDLYNIVPSYARRHTTNGDPICNQLIPDAQKNLNIQDDTDRNFYDYDVFRCREHFDNWNKPSKNKVMLVKYENLYDNLNKVFDFLEVPRKSWAKFPPFKKRKTNWKHMPASVQLRLKKTYGKTRDYINSMPDIIVPDVIKDDNGK